MPGRGFMRRGGTIRAWGARLARSSMRLASRRSCTTSRLASRALPTASAMRCLASTARCTSASSLRGRSAAEWDDNVTLVHGDAHCWNVFLPRDGGDDLRLFDWDAWRIGIAATDLAYMMAVHWYPDRRRNLEHALLDRYHATLLRHGVRGYDRQALAEDYRLAVLMQLATPIWQASYDIPPVIWWNNLERVMLAVDDLGCRDLLS